MVELKIGVSIQYRMDGGLFNLHRFMTKSKTLTTKSRDLLFAHDCALVAHSADGMQEIVNSFAKAAISFGLQINIKKMEYMFQPIPGTANAGKDILVNGEALKRVSSFSYLDSILSEDCSVDKDIAAHLQKGIKRMEHFNQDYAVNKE